MIIEVKCFCCNKLFEIEVKDEDYIRWNNGEFVQVAFPYLSAADRELLISKTCDNCFQEMCKEEDDEEIDEDCPAF